MKYVIISNCSCESCVDYCSKQIDGLIIYSFTQAIERLIALMYTPDYMIAPVHEAKVWRE